MKKSVFALFLLLAAGFLLLNKDGVEAASIPPWPNIYSGNVLIDGSPAPDGSLIVGKIGSYVSLPVTVKNGRYAGLAVGAPDSSFFGKLVTFHLDDTVVANETDVFSLNEWVSINSGFDLTFPAFPTPTPSPTATPTNTPLPTATPDVPGAMYFSGVVELDYGSNADLLGGELVARVGSYVSEPVVLTENYGLLVFDELKVDPQDHKFIDKDVSFIIGGLLAYGNTAVFQSNGNLDIALRVAFPTPTPVPPTAIPVQVKTEVPPTTIPVTATATAPAPATATATATATSEPDDTPTSVPTAVPPTPIPTQVPSTPVVVVVTATPEAPAVVVVEEAGGCNLPGPVSPLTGTANALMMLSPLMFIAAYKGIRRRSK